MEAYGMDLETARQAVVYYRERYSAQGMYENQLYEGIRELLEDLSGRGYILGVASSKGLMYVEQILDYFQISSFFTVIEGSRMDGSRLSKGDVIQEALKKLNMENHRDQAVMVGDRKYDILGAREAGIDCIAVSYGYGSVQELEQAGPVMIVPGVDGLQRLFP